jgi:hypothetical protein
MAQANRPLPRPFTYHWGSGQITEEAAYTAQHHEPVIQLLEYDDPEHAGAWSIRFCFYSPSGRFQRSPLVIGDDELEGLRAALRRTPRLRKLLRRLVQER